MRHFFACGVFEMVDAIARWSMPGGEGDLIDEGSRTHADAYEEYYPSLDALGLTGTKASLKRIVAVLRKDGSTYGELIDICKQFTGRIVDETEDKVFFSLSPRESDLHDNPRKGWEKAIERFPAIIDDVEEASRCFSLSRYPAAVFHSLQIIEAGLIELGTFLKVTDPHSGWTAVSSALKKTIDKKHTERTLFEKKNFVFLEQLQGLVQGLKNAWRNKISHVHGRIILISTEFSPDVAEEILIATRAFMRRLAEQLPPPKPRKASKK